MASSSKLVAYFSRPGNNYVGDQIVDLPIGNTEVMARKVQELTGSDLFRIRTVKPYPAGYNEATKVAKEELRKQARPELVEAVDGMSSYDAIIVGYPNWWGTIPMPVATFLSSHHLEGKTIVPFCTHEGSGLGRSVEDIRKLCPKSTVRDGLAVRGGEVMKADREIIEWLRSNHIGLHG